MPDKPFHSGGPAFVALQSFRGSNRLARLGVSHGNAGISDQPEADSRNVIPLFPEPYGRAERGKLGDRWGRQHDETDHRGAQDTGGPTRPEPSPERLAPAAGTDDMTDMDREYVTPRELAAEIKAIEERMDRRHAEMGGN